MPEKVIQIHEDDADAWEAFEAMAGDEAPAVLAALVRRYVEDQQVEPNGEAFVQIELRIIDDQKSEQVRRFRGRWLIDPADGVRSKAWNWKVIWGVALTARGRFVVYAHHEDSHVPDEFTVYEDEEEMLDGVPRDILDRVRRALGHQPAVELDI
jgi:hypothetical protein